MCFAYTSYASMVYVDLTLVNLAAKSTTNLYKNILTTAPIFILVRTFDSCQNFCIAENEGIVVRSGCSL